MLDACFSQLYFGPSLNTLQLELPAIAGLLVSIRVEWRTELNALKKVQGYDMYKIVSRQRIAHCREGAAGRQAPQWWSRMV